MGFSLPWHLLGAWASVVTALRLSCSVACGIFPDQGSNLCLLHWEADYYPLHHQGSPLPRSFCFDQLLALFLPSLMTYLLLWLFISAPANFNTYGGDPLKTPGSQPMTPHLEHPNLISTIAVEQDPMVLGLPVLSLPFVCEKTLAKE